MESVVGSPLFWAALAIAFATAVFKGAAWYGAVNSDRDSFREFMQEVRNDIKAILLKLSPPVAESGSPIRLTDLGERISGEVGARGIARELLDDVLPQVRGKSAYDIQEFCFDRLNERDLPLSEAQVDGIKQCAFDNGVETLSVRRVIAIELRNLVLGQLGLELQ